MSKQYDIFQGGEWGEYLFFMLTDYDAPDWYVCGVPLADKEAPTNREFRHDLLHRALSCSLCPPHQGDNHGRRGKRGTRQRIYKMQRRGRA